MSILNPQPDLSKLGNTELKPSEVKKEVIEHPSEEVKALSQKLDIYNADTIENFGIEAQEELDSNAKKAINVIKTRNTGEIGQQINQLMTVLNDNQPGAQKPTNLLERIFHKGKQSLFELQTRYQTVSVSLDKIKEQLKTTQNQLQVSNQELDELYTQNQKYYKDLDKYIQAGTLKLYELDNKILPQAKAELKADDDPLNLQAYQQLTDYRSQLSRRIYDLKLAQQVSLQQAPQIQSIQGSNRLLSNKINTSINSLIPLWRNQMEISMQTAENERAIKIDEGIRKTTNMLLNSNSKRIHDSTIKVAQSSQEGIVDIDTLKNIWQRNIDEVKAIKQISQDGEKKRQANAKRLEALQNEYQNSIRSMARRDITDTAEEDDDPKLKLIGKL